MAARKNRVTLDQRWRDKIRATEIMTRVRDHLEGKIELTPTQIRAAEILLKKIIPDLQSIDQALTLDTGVDSLTPEELARQAAMALAANPDILIDVLRNNRDVCSMLAKKINALENEFVAEIQQSVAGIQHVERPH